MAIRSPKLTDKRLSIKDQKNIAKTVASLEQSAIQFSEGYLIRRQISGHQGFIPHAPPIRSTRRPGVFDITSINNDDKKIKFGYGIVKFVGYSFAEYTDVDFLYDLPTPSYDTNFFVYVVADRTNSAITSFQFSNSKLTDDKSAGVFYIPIYVMQFKEGSEEDGSEDYYIVVSDIRNAPCI